MCTKKHPASQPTNVLMLWRFLLPYPFFCFSLFTFLDSFFLLFIIMVNGCFYAIAWLLYCVFMLRTHTASIYSHEESLWDRKIYVQSFCLYFPFFSPLTTFSSFTTVNNKNVEEVLEKHTENVCGITICRIFFC